MTFLQTIKQDKILLSGWALLAVSAIMFCVPLVASVSPEQYLGFFALHFGLAIIYWAVRFFNKAVRVDEHRIHHRMVHLLLLLLSAYALNREMEVFAGSPTWFSIVLVILSLNYLSSIFFEKLPTALRYTSLFIYGVALIVFIYLAFYLLPLYIISIPGILFFGISVHSFVPLLFVIISFFMVRRLAAENRRYWLTLFGGIIATVLFCIGFIANWSNKVHAINQQQTAAMVQGEDKLPLWIQVAQNIDRDAITEKILKTDLIYKIPKWGGDIFFNIPDRKFGDQQQVHDPLVILANMFSGNVFLQESDRIKILESQYNARHQALERLWSGEHLKTQQVVSNVKIWPQMRFAYTEKLITVYNHQSKQRWPRQGEGIYTFHMPEGAVVTSLSLWINGKEEKAILTSKQKATTAYRTIVGYERRDPSVVHWQEGNTVSVRVFPVDAENSRTFKIGITAPLRKQKKQLLYDNIWFDGPDASSAEETVRVEVADKHQSLVQQALFTPDKNKSVTRSGSYQPRWSMAFDDEDMQQNYFSFNGHQYSIKPYEPQRISTVIADVYLDINNAWSADDFKNVWKLLSSKRVWVYSNKMEAVTDENKDELFALLQKRSFSLFPFHLVDNHQQSLVITKSGSYSPTISDLEGSRFLKGLEEKLNSEQRVKLFDIGTDMSPYIRSLKERRCFDFEHGGPELLVRLITNNLFTANQETDNAIVIHSADVVITKQAGEGISSAPDHVMRLFAYNHILQQTGRKDSASLADSTTLVKEAEEAYVVSPVSSLVVLETQHDYDRFDIKASEKSLKNASINSNGAVPEPGEWLIIILAGTAFLLFVYKTKFA